MQITQKRSKNIMDTQAGYMILDVRTEKNSPKDIFRVRYSFPDYEIGERAESELTDKDQLILVYCRSGRRNTATTIDKNKLVFISKLTFIIGEYRTRNMSFGFPRRIGIIYPACVIFFASSVLSAYSLFVRLIAPYKKLTNIVKTAKYYTNDILYRLYSVQILSLLPVEIASLLQDCSSIITDPPTRLRLQGI